MQYILFVKTNLATVRKYCLSRKFNAISTFYIVYINSYCWHFRLCNFIIVFCINGTYSTEQTIVLKILWRRGWCRTTIRRTIVASMKTNISDTFMCINLLRLYSVSKKGPKRTKQDLRFPRATNLLGTFTGMASDIWTSQVDYATGNYPIRCARM